MALERAKLFVPMRLELVEPRAEGRHRFRSQAEHAQARIVWDAFVGDETRLEQDPKMPTHHRSGGASGRRQLTGPMRSLTEKLDHPPSRRICKRDENFFNIVPHSLNS